MRIPDTTCGPLKARLIYEPAEKVIGRWLASAVIDFKNNLFVSLAYGGGLFVAGWTFLTLLWYFGLGWALLPIIAGGMLIGPLAAVGTYRVGRRGQGAGGGGIASLSQVVLIGIILMVFALAWIRAATLIFAIFFALCRVH